MSTLGKALFVAAGFTFIAAGATSLHANKGCINVNNVALCDNFSPMGLNGGQALIYAQFDGSDHSSQYVDPGCQLLASWPSNYGDIFFGADNCLYDAQGNNIDGQCCVSGTGGSNIVLNPYYGN
ncbi:hypothetical protein F5884DRAFT_753978 [Xylogone sp. PMI_703]|nr:hypothetical protein F5884DRAFT_753978 [Xylogone sp. PMI_703]